MTHRLFAYLLHCGLKNACWQTPADNIGITEFLLRDGGQMSDEKAFLRGHAIKCP